MDTAIFYKHLYSIRDRLASSSDYSVTDLHRELHWLERRFALRRHLAQHKYMNFADWRLSGAPNDSELTVLISEDDLDRLDMSNVEEYANNESVRKKYPDVHFISLEKHEESKRPALKPLEESAEVEEDTTKDVLEQIDTSGPFNESLTSNQIVSSNLEPLRGGVRVFAIVPLKMPSSRSVMVSAGGKTFTLEPGDGYSVAVGLDIKLNAMEQVFTILGGIGGSAERMSKSALETVRRVIGEVNYIGLDGRNESHLSLPSFKNEVDKVVDESILVYAIGKNASSLMGIRTESGKPYLTWSEFNKATHSGNSLTHHLLNNVRNSLFTSDPAQVKTWLKEVDKPIEKSGFVAKFSKSLGNTDVLKSFFETDETIEKDYLKELDTFIQDYFDRLIDKRGKDAAQTFKIFRSAIENLALNPEGKELSGSEAVEAVNKAKADVRAFLTYDGKKAAEVIKQTVEEAASRNFVDSESAKLVYKYISDESNIKNLDKHLDQITKQHYDRIPQENAVKVALNRLQPGLYESVSRAFESKGIRGGVHTLMKLSGEDKFEAVEILEGLTNKLKRSGSPDIKSSMEFIETSGLASIIDAGGKREAPALYILLKNVIDSNSPVGYSQTDPQYSSRTAWRSAHHTVELGKLLNEYSKIGVRTNSNRAAIKSFVDAYVKAYPGDTDIWVAKDRLTKAEEAIRKSYLSDPSAKKDAPFESMVSEVEPELAETLKLRITSLDELVEDKIRQSQDPIPASLKSKFTGIDKYNTIADAFDHLVQERNSIEATKENLKQNLREHVVSAAKPFLGLAGNPMMQLNDHVNKSMGASVPVRRMDNSGPANIKDLKSYMKSGKVNEIVYGVIALSYKHSRGANTAKPRKPGRGISLYTDAPYMKNKATAVSSLEKILGKLAILKKSIIDTTKAYDTHKLSPLDSSKSADYESMVNRTLGICEDIRSLNKDGPSYINEITKAVDVYVQSPNLMDNSAIGSMSSDVTDLHPNRSDAGSVVFSGIDQVSKQVKSTSEYLKKAPKPKQSDVFVNEYSISADEADQMLFRIFNWFPTKFSNLSTAIKQAKNFASNRYDRGDDADYKSTLMSLWMLEGDQEAMTEAAKKAGGTGRTESGGTRKPVEGGGFTSPNLAIMKVSPEPSIADVRHAVHILVGYLGGSLQKRDFKSLNPKWQDYILTILKDSKYGSRRWADLLGVMKDYGFWVDINTIEDKSADPASPKKGMDIVAYKTDLSLALAITTMGYIMEGKFPPSESTLRNTTDWINRDDQRTVKSDLAHLILHVPELIDLGNIKRLKDPQNLSEALRSWQTVKAEEGFDLKRYVEDLVPHIKDWARKAGLDLMSLKSTLVGRSDTRDPLDIIKTHYQSISAKKALVGSPNANMTRLFEEMSSSTLRILSPQSFQGQSRLPGALGRYLGQAEEQLESFRTFKTDLLNDGKTSETVDASTNTKIITINQRRHSWTQSAVSPVNGSPPPAQEWYLFGYKYANEVEWEKDKSNMDKSLDGLIRALEDLVKDVESLPGKSVK